MTALYWTLLTLFGISVVGKAIWLATELPARTKADAAGDIVINVALMLWIVRVWR